MADRCFYRHDVSQCKRFESKPASPPPDVVSFGATCTVPDYTASIPMSNAPTPMFYNISTESEPKTPTSRSSVGDSLPAVPFFPDFHTSEEDANNATSAAIDVEEAPRAQTIDEESLSSSSLFDGTYAEDGFICPAREWCTFETLAVDSNVRNELYNCCVTTQVDTSRHDSLFADCVAHRPENDTNIEPEEAFLFDVCDAVTEVSSCSQCLNEDLSFVRDPIVSGAAILNVPKRYDCLFCNTSVLGSDICSRCVDPALRPPETPPRRRRHITWR